MTEEPKKLTRYKLLLRSPHTDRGIVSEVNTFEAAGAVQAIRAQMVSTPLEPGESYIAVPVSNWTERGSRPRQKVILDLFDPHQEMIEVEEPTPEPTPEEDDGA